MKVSEIPDFRPIAQLNREMMGRIWRKLQEDPESIGADEHLLAEQMLEHGEYHDVWNQIDDLTEHYFDPSTEENPFLHILLHVTLERQILENDPPYVVVTLERLIASGMEPHEARHAILRVLVGEIFRILSERSHFDLERYRGELDKL